jgi:alanyl-tRNA synthetase
VGIEAFRDLAAERAIVSQLSTSLKLPREQLPERISELVTSLKSAEKRIAEFETKALLERVPALLEQRTTVGTVQFIGGDLGKLASSDELRALVTTVRSRLGTDPAVVALAAEVDGKPAVIVATNQSSRDLGNAAGALAKAAAATLGGGGGGKPDLAQGGGSRLDAIPAAIETIRSAVKG